MGRAADWVRDYRYLAARQLRARSEMVVPSRFADGDRAPVVLLAGVLEPWTVLLPVALLLHAAGHPVHVVEALGFNTLSIPRSAALVAEQLRVRDLRGVVLVAHSKGGLIGKRLLVDDGEGRIDRLVALATPWHGSTMARLVPGRVIGSLRPGDPVIAALAANHLVDHRITSIYPAWDQHVPEGSRLPGATNVAVPCRGHHTLLGDPRALAEVLAAVERKGAGDRTPLRADAGHDHHPVDGHDPRCDSRGDVDRPGSAPSSPA